MNEALAAHCTDITDARTERGEELGYRLYTARWAPAGPPPSRTPTAAPRRDRKPAADPAAPFLPLQPGEWVPRVPLRHDCAVIAARVLTAPLRTARCTSRPCTARPRRTSSCSSSPRNNRPRRPVRRSTSRPCAPTWRPRS
ncbi:hypothetical protein ACH4GM_31230 [Streptomyces coeruleorubidus]|uniref:hypothetical protein n=1 Tax=Streptomyces coeruleorubidus TaxID=116188 RepID=UPI0037B1E50A